MASWSTKTGHALAKALGIKLQDAGASEELMRGESVLTTGSFVEESPTAAEWFRDLVPGRADCTHYVRSLFPFINWIGYYNAKWLVGDLVAGITVGAVVVPQGMAYALLANLEPEYGLYSSFMGVIIYWFFATSKDITIGVCYYVTLPSSSHKCLDCLEPFETGEPQVLTTILSPLPFSPQLSATLSSMFETNTPNTSRIKWRQR